MDRYIILNTDGVVHEGHEELIEVFDTMVPYGGGEYDCPWMGDLVLAKEIKRRR